jgi:hypothetical protein
MLYGLGGCGKGFINYAFVGYLARKSSASERMPSMAGHVTPSDRRRAVRKLLPTDDLVSGLHSLVDHLRQRLHDLTVSVKNIA